MKIWCSMDVLLFSSGLLLLFTRSSALTGDMPTSGDAVGGEQLTAVDVDLLPVPSQLKRADFLQARDTAETGDESAVYEGDAHSESLQRKEHSGRRNVSKSHAGALHAMAEQTRLQQSLAELREELRRLQVSAVADKQEVQNAQRDEAELRNSSKALAARLTAVREDRRRLSADRDAALRSQANLTTLGHQFVASLKLSKSKLDEVFEQLNRSRLDFHEAESLAEARSNETREMKVELAELRAAYAKQDSESQQRLKDTMHVAAAKMQAMEAERARLRESIGNLTGQLHEIQAEGSRARKSLRQEGDAAVEAHRRTVLLGQELQEAMEAANASRKHAAELERTLQAMQAERVSLQEGVNQSTREVSELATKARGLQDKAKQVAVAQHKAETERRTLRAQSSLLAGAGERAALLAREVEGLQANADREAARAASAERDVQDLRDLEESEFANYTVLKDQSDAYHASADNFTAQLQKVRAELERSDRARDLAVESATRAATNEDEYFDDNVRLRRESEQLESQIKEVQHASEGSVADTASLRAQVAQLKSEAEQQDDRFHATWLSNEETLRQVESGIRAANAATEELESEIAATQELLTDGQRKALGLAVGSAAQVGTQRGRGPAPLSAQPPPATGSQTGLASSDGATAAGVSPKSSQAAC